VQWLWPLVFYQLQMLWQIQVKVKQILRLVVRLVLLVAGVLPVQVQVARVVAQHQVAVVAAVVGSRLPWHQRLRQQRPWLVVDLLIHRMQHVSLQQAAGVSLIPKMLHD
jgi:hypothetical protein